MRLRTSIGVFSFAAAALLSGCSDGDDGANGAAGANGNDGANGSSSLVTMTPLGRGDANCPSGGTQIDAGLDNGDGGGTANDGVLQAGEVDATQRVCSDGRQGNVGSLVAPAGAAGTFFMNARGGDATATGGIGGDGGYLDFQHDYGTNGGHIKIWKTGAVDASFTAPAVPPSKYGVTPLVVASGTTHVKRVAALTDATDVNATALVAGDIVLVGCAFSNMYRWQSTSSNEQITGVHVQSGATLTFDHYAGCTSRQFNLPTTFRNEGSVTTGGDANGNLDALYMQVGNFVSTAGSTFDLRGINGASGTNGGNGGYLQVSADRLDGEDGSIWSYGTIDNSGGSGDNGGNGGGAYFYGANQTIVTGNVTSRGGDATLASGTAGQGGGVDLESGYGQFASSATLDTRGGSGGTVAGDGGYVYFYNNVYGSLRNTGEIRTTGGTPTAGCAAACRGGAGGDVYLEATGDILSSANITSTGGDGLSGNGGDGGYIYFYVDYNSSLGAGNYNTLTGNIWVSGNLDSHGGNGGARGGEGGYIYAETDLYSSPWGQEIAFFGYGGGINASGGNGDAQGGNATYLYVYQTYGYTNGGDSFSGGSIVNDVDVTLKGGNATNGAGGNGGYFWLTTSDQRYGYGGYEQVINRGNVDTSGGNGTTSGGYASYAFILGLDDVTNTGTITALGGNASAGNGGYVSSSEYSDEGNHSISLISDGGRVSNSAALTANGGTGVGAGAGGGYTDGILLLGYVPGTSSGALTANGGAGDSGSGTGGYGGNIVIRANTGFSANAGAVGNSGGAGATPGANGLYVLDGQIQ